MKLAWRKWGRVSACSQSPEIILAERIGIFEFPFWSPWCLEERLSRAKSLVKHCHPSTQGLWKSNLFKVHEFEIWKLNFHCTSSKLLKNKAQVETCYVKVEALIALLVGQVQEDVNRFHFHAHAHKFVLNSAILPTKTTKNCISSKDRESHQNHAFEQCKASNQQKLLIWNQ